MVPRFLSLTLCSLLFAGLAHADKFYLHDGDVVGNGTAFIEGVLLRTVEDVYEIRVEGGLVTLPRALVVRIDKDSLAVADIENRERERAPARRELDARRREAQAAPAAARRREAAHAAEAAAPQATEVEPGTEAAYDPILHVVRKPTTIKRPVAR